VTVHSERDLSTTLPVRTQIFPTAHADAIRSLNPFIEIVAKCTKLEELQLPIVICDRPRPTIFLPDPQRFSSLRTLSLVGMYLPLNLYFPSTEVWVNGCCKRLFTDVVYQLEELRVLVLAACHIFGCVTLPPLQDDQLQKFEELWIEGTGTSELLVSLVKALSGRMKRLVIWPADHKEEGILKPLNGNMVLNSCTRLDVKNPYPDHPLLLHIFPNLQTLFLSIDSFNSDWANCLPPTLEHLIISRHPGLSGPAYQSAYSDPFFVARKFGNLRTALMKRGQSKLNKMDLRWKATQDKCDEWRIVAILLGSIWMQDGIEFAVTIDVCF
jgi:hypothetical protein